MNIFNNRIKILRKQKKLKQRELAEVLDITERAYRNYEIKHAMPTLDNLISIANYFDVSIDYLVGRCDNPNSHKKS